MSFDLRGVRLLYPLVEVVDQLWTFGCCNLGHVAIVVEQIVAQIAKCLLEGGNSTAELGVAAGEQGVAGEAGEERQRQYAGGVFSGLIGIDLAAGGDDDGGDDHHHPTTQQEHEPD